MLVCEDDGGVVRVEACCEDSVDENIIYGFAKRLSAVGLSRRKALHHQQTISALSRRQHAGKSRQLLRVYPVDEDIEDSGVHVGEFERKRVRVVGCTGEYSKVMENIAHTEGVVLEEGGVDKVFLCQRTDLCG
jgi:hypothetical protein